MDAYSRATQLLTDHKKALLDIADALLAREVLDADQVRKLARGEALDDHHPVMPPPPSGDASRDRAREQKERPQIVPQLQKPLTQE
jgi:cell division protease FtsH